MKTCSACKKKVYKDYRTIELFAKSIRLCNDCGTVSFQPWPGGETVQGRVMALKRRTRGKGREKTMTLHTDAAVKTPLEIRDITFGNIPNLPAGIQDRAKVIRVRTLYTPKPPKKKKKKTAPEGGDEAASQEAPPRFKKSVAGFSIYASFQ